MQTVDVEITGTSPLLFCKPPDDFTGGRSDKDEKPAEKARKHLHTIKNGRAETYVLPSIMLHKAVQLAGGYHKFKQRATLRKIMAGAVQITPEYLPIEPQIYTIDSRMVCLHTSGPRPVSILAYRPRFDEWKAKFNVTYNERFVSQEQMRAVMDDAGTLIGLGSFAPRNGGPFGRFIVTRWES